MNDLLALTINAHGGMERWKQFKAVSAHLVTGGVLWNIKGKAGMLDDIHVTVALHRQWASHAPFGAPNQHTSLEAERVAIEATDGTVIEELLHPRASFKDHTQETPWTNLQLAYFAGYAMWTYLTSPFTFTLPGYEVEEMEPWQENGETWRRLQVTFGPYIATHSKVQTFYIDKDGLIRRHDYDVEISGGTPAVHYLSDHTEVSGIIVPTKRLVYIRQPDLSPLKEPLIVSIQLSDIKFSELEPAIHFHPSGNELVSGTL
jgi:hypothetical protein